MEDLILGVVQGASALGEACGLPVAVFDHAVRDFVREMPCAFCQGCSLARSSGCDPKMAHTYGCFEAERWRGLYVYYCPLSLAFVATTVYEQRRAAYAMVTGPVVLGQIEDANALDESEIAQLPQRSPQGINAISRLQWSQCRYLSEPQDRQPSYEESAHTELMGTLYELTEAMRSGQVARYPLEIEQRLQHMIKNGDKQGAQELINQLLGALYFSTAGDFDSIKRRAAELIVLFSRASAEGGADVNKIFGLSGGVQREIERMHDLDALSRYLTSMFYRFVGYVFDFSQFEHTDILHKAVSFLRENLSAKITLETLAEHVGLSRSYLSTILKAELGMTFTDYLNQMRVEKGKELLLNPALSLAEIADLVGYNDQSYFTKKFAQQTGMSPGQYRKKRGQVV